MLQNMQIDIIGVVENMSYFQCPKCGEQTYIFSHGGCATTAEKYGVPCFSSYQDLVARADIDLVCVATPHALHAEHALAVFDLMTDGGGLEAALFSDWHAHEMALLKPDVMWLPACWTLVSASVAPRCAASHAPMAASQLKERKAPT